MKLLLAPTHIHITPPQLETVGISLPNATANDSRWRLLVACAKITSDFSVAFRRWLFAYVLQWKFCMHFVYATVSTAAVSLPLWFYKYEISPRFLPGLVLNFVIEENWVSFDRRCRSRCMYVQCECMCSYLVYAFGSPMWNDCEPNTYLTLNLAA